MNHSYRGMAYSRFAYVTVERREESRKVFHKPLKKEGTFSKLHRPLNVAL